MPALGMAQETGKVLRWLAAEGDEVQKGAPLLEVETDKVTVEVEAPADGVLGGLRAGEGEDVPVGEVIAYVLADGEEAPAGGPAVRGERSRAPAAVGAVAAPAAPATAETGNGAPPRRTLASPKARRLAAERGVAIEEIVGSGPHGAVVAADVDAVVKPATSETVKTTVSEDVKREPLEVSSVWRVMAERTQRSWQTVPHFFLVRDVDASRLNSWRDALLRRPGTDRVTHTDLLVRLAAAALAEHPRVNASWRDGQIAGSEAANVGVAVAVEDGLVVPVIRDAGSLSLAEIAAERMRLVAAARNRKLRPDDVQGGTFTLSNLGMFGVDGFLAIVNEPQAAILAVGRIADRVVAVDGLPAVRPTMTLSLSFDHRVVDGAAGARFLDTLAALVEEPAALVS